MITLRYLRRRGFGIAWKAFLGCSVVFFTIQIANTFPRRSHKDRQAEIRPLPDSRDGSDFENDADRNRVYGGRPNNAFISHLGNAERPISVHENEFYENVIVHFDLKGAPPRISYFMDLLDLVARSGATGILLEWEDMFPWTGQLATARSADAYSMDDVRKILSKARSLNLDIIPLMQSFGHLEWILKLEPFRKYRENDAYPQVRYLITLHFVKTCTSCTSWLRYHILSHYIKEC
ncbi:unnamed protein product [Heligmosomoides polygyrus]|uniref:Beta-N-acetylhexosaminidase n=1 Tax=Heligmosomoides polygyrus TaxID=6339 RepID=A0A183GRJ3_HELPZ|nr:unnamed protein product [Heligmosomoides polygyrus]